jgi:hypothetical protein
MAYLGGSIDSHRDQDIRRAMHLLKELAHKTRTAIVLVRHLNKLGHNVALYRGGGSIGIVGAARSAIVVGRDPDDSTILVVASGKSNLGPAPKSLTYSLIPVGNVARIGWGGQCELGANDILSHPAPQQGKATAAAVSFLEKILAVGPVPVKEVFRQAQTADIAEKTVRRAAKKMGIKKAKAGFGGGWTWALPSEDGQEDGHNVELATFEEKDAKTLCFPEDGHSDELAVLEKPKEKRKGGRNGTQKSLCSPEDGQNCVLEDGHLGESGPYAEGY